MLTPEQITSVCQEIAARDNIVGLLVCGSYIYGTPTEASDFDIRAVTNDGSNSDERQTWRYGIRIEVFINSPEQVRLYLEECRLVGRSETTHFWAHGQIVVDKTGIMAELQKEARALWLAGPRNGGPWQHKAKWAGRVLPRDW